MESEILEDGRFGCLFLQVMSFSMSWTMTRIVLIPRLLSRLLLEYARLASTDREAMSFELTKKKGRW